MTHLIDGLKASQPEVQNQRLIWTIAVIGAVPMLIFTSAILISGGHSGTSAPLIDAYKIYSAIVLSFLGGIHWGIVLGAKEEVPSSKTLLVSVAAPLIGWIAVFVSEPMCFALLIVGFAGQGAWDNFAAHNGKLPLWFSKTRMILTIVVIISMAVAMYATA